MMPASAAMREIELGLPGHGVGDGEDGCDVITSESFSSVWNRWCRLLS